MHNNFQVWWVFVFVLGMAGIQAVTRIITSVIDRTRSAQPTGTLRDIAEKMERMNQAIEATAIEVERIGESQRFLTKVLSDKSQIEDNKTIAAR
jgi:hypothetical protein